MKVEKGMVSVESCRLCGGDHYKVVDYVSKKRVVVK